MSRWKTVPLSPNKRNFPQWLGTNDPPLKTRTIAYTWKYQPAYLFRVSGNPPPPSYNQCANLICLEAGFDSAPNVVAH